MNVKSLRQFLPAALLIAALAACTPIQAPATTETPAATEAATAEPAATVATEEEATAEPMPMPIEGVDAATCDALQAALSEKLGTELTQQEGGTCTLTATGTGEDFGTMVDVAQSIGETLEAEGWTLDESTQADGPTGTSVSYFKELTVAAVIVNWEPSEDAECPTDQPISACELEPSQQIFTITINLVQIA